MADVVIVNRSGKRITELKDADIEAVTWELNAPGTCAFTIPSDDDSALYPRNWIPNPSAEFDTDGDGTADNWGWMRGRTEVGVALTGVGGDAAVFGKRAQQVAITNLAAASGGSGYYFRLWDPTARLQAIPIVAGQKLAASLYLRVTAAVRANITAEIIYLDAGRSWLNSSSQLLNLSATTANMTRYSVVATVPSGVAFALLVIHVQGDAAAAAGTPGNLTFQVDGAQLEYSPYVSTFTELPVGLPRVFKDEVQVWEGDQLVWWGVPWTVRGDHRTTRVECQGLLSYFLKRFITTTSLQYDSLDQTTIAWNLLSHAQTGANRDLKIAAGAFLTSGKTRSRLYPRDEHANILDLLNEFPTLDDGFDFDIVVSGSGLREFWAYYPAKGSTKAALALDWGRNITGYGYSEDGTDFATKVYATGGSAGDVKFENNYTDALAAEEYGEFHSIVSEGSVLDVGWLLERATEEVQRRKAPIRLPELTLSRETGAADVLFNLHTGDVVPVRLAHGRTYLNDNYKVVVKTWKPGPNTVDVVVNTL